jgi:hypothetical protein
MIFYDWSIISIPSTSMAQGDNKMDQKGTNAIFIMTHNEIAHAQAANKFFTYKTLSSITDHRNRKSSPIESWIEAGGNLINCKTNASVRTADLDTVRLHLNSIISTALAKYMCLDIKNFYLTAALDYFEYMKIPLTLFQEWIVEQ